VDPESRVRKLRNYTIDCYIQSSQGKVGVCKQSFLSILSIGRAKLEKAAQTMCQFDTDMQEIRGGSWRSMGNLKEDIIQHIKCYRVRERHYNRNGTVGRMYLPADLTVKRMFEDFVQKHPDSTCKYNFYYNVFRTSFNIGFGSVKTDTCSTCEKFTNLLKASAVKSTVASGDSEPIGDLSRKEIMAQRLLHKLRAKRFFYELNLCPDNSITINFDLMQNQPLLKTSIGEAYYARQLWYYTFGIVLHKPTKELNKSTLYYYRLVFDKFSKKLVPRYIKS